VTLIQLPAGLFASASIMAMATGRTDAAVSSEVFVATVPLSGIIVVNANAVPNGAGRPLSRGPKMPGGLTIRAVGAPKQARTKALR
jgi:hypothetical protein